MKPKTDSVLVGVASLMLIGCAYAGPLDECADLSSLKLKVKENHLDLKDKNENNNPACIALGGSFTIKVQSTGGGDPPVEKGSVWVKAVDGSPLTISGNNSEDEKELVVTVEGNSVPAELVKYEIHVDDIGMLDPRVRVVDVNPLMMLQSEVLLQTIADWSIDVVVLENVIRQLKEEGY